MFILSLIFFLLISPLDSSTKTITDILGRSINIPNQINRIILSEGRQVFIIAALEEKQDPFKRIVGIGNDLRLNDKDAYEKYNKKFKKLKNIKEIGSVYKNNINLELLASLKPQVIILTLSYYHQAKRSNLIQNLNKLGIHSIFIDFREFPTKNTIKSIEILGKLLSVEKKATSLIKFYNQYLNLVKERVKEIPYKKKPLVFIEIAPGYFDNPKEYKTFGYLNMGQFIHIAGGIHLLSKISKFTNAFSINISPEMIFSNDPEKIIFTACNWSSNPSAQSSNWIPIGYHTEKKNTQKKLSQLIKKRPLWDKLKAVKTKNIYTIYHQFYNSPYHFIAILQFAKWFHPEKFKDIFPNQIFKEFHKKFLPIEFSGLFWDKLE